MAAKLHCSLIKHAILSIFLIKKSLFENVWDHYKLMAVGCHRSHNSSAHYLSVIRDIRVNLLGVKLDEVRVDRHLAVTTLTGWHRA